MSVIKNIMVGAVFGVRTKLDRARSYTQELAEFVGLGEKRILLLKI